MFLIADKETGMPKVREGIELPIIPENFVALEGKLFAAVEPSGAPMTTILSHGRARPDFPRPRHVPGASVRDESR